MKNKVTALVGAQFGSEGKGLVAADMASEYQIHVRTGAPNAGHTYYADHYEGKALGRRKVVARSIPCGAINQDATLVIGAGAMIDVDLLLAEAAELDALGWEVTERLMVDPLACVIDPVRHHGFEGGVDGRAHVMIGSTGEGVGPARMAKIARGTFPADVAQFKLDRVADPHIIERLVAAGISVRDTAKYLNDAYDLGASVLLEGTQGSGLSLVHGPWPYVTSSDTNAGQLATDAGLAPSLVNDVVLVARTFPIRVAGNSGPLPKETGWAAIGMPPEHTTVTKKERRVAWFHEETVRRAIMLNRPSRMAMTFLDYLFPEDANVTEWAELSDMARSFVANAERELGVGIVAVGTGPDSLAVNTGEDRVHDSRFLDSNVKDGTARPWPSFLESYTELGVTA